jgi:hypothetical protein
MRVAGTSLLPSHTVWVRANRSHVRDMPTGIMIHTHAYIYDILMINQVDPNFQEKNCKCIEILDEKFSSV